MQRVNELGYQNTLIVDMCVVCELCDFPVWWERGSGVVGVVVPYTTSLFSKRGDLIPGRIWVDYCSGSRRALCHPGAGLWGLSPTPEVFPYVTPVTELGRG